MKSIFRTLESLSKTTSASIILLTYPYRFSKGSKPNAIMGFWDKIVKAKNYFTGGGAEVYVEFASEPYLRRPFRVKVFVRVKEVDIEIDKIYLVVKNIEEVEIKNVSMPSSTPNTPGRTTGNNRKTVRQSHIISKQEFILDENVLLNAGQEFDWETEIQLPIEGMHSYVGKYTKIYWTMQAFLEKAGNDPNSKVIPFDPLYDIS